LKQQLRFCSGECLVFTDTAVPSTDISPQARIFHLAARTGSNLTVDTCECQGLGHIDELAVRPAFMADMLYVHGSSAHKMSTFMKAGPGLARRRSAKLFAAERRLPPETNSFLLRLLEAVQIIVRLRWVKGRFGGPMG
jgi:hypothetical protein